MSLIDAVGILDDLWIRRLAEDGRQACDRYQTAGDQVAQHIACSHRWKLVHVPDQQQVRAWPQGLEQIVGQDQVKHGGFVHYQEVCREWVVLIVLEAFERGEFQQTVDGAGVPSAGFSLALGSTSGGGGQGYTFVLGFESCDQGFQTGGLAGSGTARQDADRVLERHLNSRLLFCR